MFEVRAGLLYQDGQLVTQRPSPNHSGPMVPTLIVIHYTASSINDDAKGDISWLCNPESQVSAHLVISGGGEVTQLVPFNVRAWHAGVSSYNGRSVGGSVNAFSIGIENDGEGDFWPDTQLEALKGVLEALCAAYQIEDIVGHEDVAPGRKADPGPRFPWDRVTRPKE